MLSISAMTFGLEEYYLELGREDYYLEGGEPPGAWVGHAANVLGLEGLVGKDDLRALLRGFSPHGTKLVQNAGHRDRKPGWDLTFSAPKSVSVLWAYADKNTQTTLRALHFLAVTHALSHLEEHAAITRRDAAGQTLERASPIFALFEHGTSRAQDPQLHTHALLINAGLRDDGSWGALRSSDFYNHKMLLGALYRVELAYLLRHELGLDPQRKRTWFELKGVPRELVEEFSTRRKEIEKAMAARSLTGPEAAARMTLTTRRVKDHVARCELFPRWREVGSRFGFSVERAWELIHGRRKPHIPWEERHAIGHVRDAIRDLSHTESFFSEQQVLRAAAEALQDGSVSSRVLVAALNSELGRTPEVIRLGQENGYTLYTTPELVDLEGKIIDAAHATRDHRQHAIDRDRVDKVLAAGRVRRFLDRSETLASKADTARRLLGLHDLAQLSGEQRAAVHHLTTTPGSMKCLTGIAGTGKTRMLYAARKVWEHEGYRVIGATVAGKAARELEDGTGIKSETVEKTLMKLDPTLHDRLAHTGRQLWYAARHRPRKPQLSDLFRTKPSSKMERLRLDDKTVLVLDEAAMIGTRELERLTKHVVTAGAKLVLVGDDRQLPSIEAGAPFGTLVKRLGAAQLTDVRRQHADWQIEATRQFAEGDIKTALGLFAERGHVAVRDTEEQTMDALIESWTTGRTSDLKETLILAATNREANLLNLQAQAKRRQLGELGRQSVFWNKTRFRQGDRVLFTQNARGLGVRNGDLGIIEKIHDPHSRKRAAVTVKLDIRQSLFGIQLPLNKYVTFRLRDYDHLTLGYAVTTHKAQGATVDRTFVLAGGWMQDRALSYVQMSRHRERCEIFATATDAGEDLTELVRAMKRTRTKELALDREQSLQVQERLEPLMH